MPSRAALADLLLLEAEAEADEENSTKLRSRAYNLIKGKADPDCIGLLAYCYYYGIGGIGSDIVNAEKLAVESASYKSKYGIFMLGIIDYQTFQVGFFGIAATDHNYSRAQVCLGDIFLMSGIKYCNDVCDAADEGLNHTNTIKTIKNSIEIQDKQNPLITPFIFYNSRVELTDKIQKEINNDNEDMWEALQVILKNLRISRSDFEDYIKKLCEYAAAAAAYAAGTGNSAAAASAALAASAAALKQLLKSYTVIISSMMVSLESFKAILPAVIPASLNQEITKFLDNANGDIIKMNNIAADIITDTNHPEYYTHFYDDAKECKRKFYNVIQKCLAFVENYSNYRNKNSKKLLEERHDVEHIILKFLDQFVFKTLYLDYQNLQEYITNTVEASKQAADEHEDLRDDLTKISKTLTAMNDSNDTRTEFFKCIYANYKSKIDYIYCLVLEHWLDMCTAYIAYGCKESQDYSIIMNYIFHSFLFTFTDHSDSDIESVQTNLIYPMCKLAGVKSILSASALADEDKMYSDNSAILKRTHEKIYTAAKEAADAAKEAEAGASAAKEAEAAAADPNLILTYYKNLIDNINITITNPAFMNSIGNGSFITFNNEGNINDNDSINVQNIFHVMHVLQKLKEEILKPVPVVPVQKTIKSKKEELKQTVKTFIDNKLKDLKKLVNMKYIKTQNDIKIDINERYKKAKYWESSLLSLFNDAYACFEHAASQGNVYKYNDYIRTYITKNPYSYSVDIPSCTLRHDHGCIYIILDEIYDLEKGDEIIIAETNDRPEFIITDKMYSYENYVSPDIKYSVDDNKYMKLLVIDKSGKYVKIDEGIYKCTFVHNNNNIDKSLDIYKSLDICKLEPFKNKRDVFWHESLLS